MKAVVQVLAGLRRDPGVTSFFLSTSGLLETGNGHAQKVCVQECLGSHVAGSRVTHGPVCTMKSKSLSFLPPFPLLSSPLPSPPPLPSLFSPLSSPLPSSPVPFLLQPFLLLPFPLSSFKKIIYHFMCTCVCLRSISCVHKSLRSPEEGARFPGTVATGECELPSVGAQNQTWSSSRAVSFLND